MITYRCVKRDDLKTIADIHTECFSGYFLTSLGKDLLEKYYGEYIAEDAPFIVAEDDSGEIVGFCMGFDHDSKARANFERKYKYGLAIKLICLCAKFNKQAWVRVLSRIRGILESFVLQKKNHVLKSDMSKNEGVLLSICVLDRVKGTGVACSLVKAFENELIMRKIDVYTLSAYATNFRARVFYEKNGLKVESEENGSVVYIKKLN